MRDSELYTFPVTTETNKPIQVSTSSEDSKILRIAEFLDTGHKKLASLPALGSDRVYTSDDTADTH
jgi:hypothetical protein